MRPEAFVVGLALWSGVAEANMRVAVVPFDNAGGEEFEPLGVGLQAMVTTDLAQDDEVTVVERAKLKDLLNEVELSSRGLVDAKTAAEIGKLTGATHVVAGAFTVVGDQMRLDARIADVATGQVTAAQEVSGEKEAFFELEKTLVKKLLVDLGADLSPKERAAIGRIHTADFDSFTQFSSGVALFDADRYAEALATLQSVADSDADFKLASMTIADIRAVQKEAEKKARAAQVASAEEAFAVRAAEAEREAEVLRKLQRIASDPKRDWQDRVTANLLIYVGLAKPNHGGFRELKDHSDRWTLERVGERAYQAAFAEMSPRVPEWFPATPTPSPWFSEKFGFDKVFDDHRTKWFGEESRHYRLSLCETYGKPLTTDQMEALWVPRRRQMELQMAYLDSVAGCMSERGRHRSMIEVAKQMQRLGHVGPSSAILERVTKESADEGTLRQVASVAEDNAEMAEVANGLKPGTPEHELVTIGREAVDDGLLSDLNYHVRAKWPLYDPLFIGGIPMWRHVGIDHQMATGPRTSTDTATSVRFYSDSRRYRSYGQPADTPPMMVVAGGVPFSEGSFEVEVSHEPTADWWPPQFREIPDGWAPNEARPSFGILWGVRDLNTRPSCDPVDHTLEAPHPMTALGALVMDGELIIAEVSQRYLEPARCNVSTTLPIKDVVVGEVLARRPHKSRGDYTLTASVQDGVFTARAGKTTVELELPAKRVGFVGLFADGEGYVELARPVLEISR